MRRRTPIVALVSLIVAWSMLTAAAVLPPIPTDPPPPLILGVAATSSTVWTLIVGCHFQPHDLVVLVNGAPPQPARAISAAGPARWHATFDGSMPRAATVHGCGQRAALVIAAPPSPAWMLALFGIGFIAACILGARLVWRPRPPTASPAPPPPIAGWQMLVQDAQGERTIALTEGIITAGSDPGCQIIVLASDTAPRHAQLMIGAEHAYIVDLASPAGVFCGPVRRRLRPHTPMLIGDEDIWLGATARLRLYRSDSSARKTGAD